MAQGLALKLEILGEFKKLSAATKGAQGSLGNLNKTAKSISTKMNSAFAAIGVGFSLAVLVDQFKQASKAAVEEVKSMELLETAMLNTGNATAYNVTQAEDFIKAMMLETSVADDLLRPAYQKLFIATGDVTESNRLLSIALDTSAATGKDLDAVTQAMARSLGGSDTALNRLVPSLKGAKDPMAELETLFKGAAEAAADTDPYKRMEIIFGELQEQVGMALLPILNEFSDWLATPEGQAKLQEIVDGFVDIIEEGIKLVRWVDQNKDWLVPMVVAIGTVTTAWGLATAAVNTFKTAAGLSAIAGVTTAVGAGTVGVLGVAGAGAAAGGFQTGQVVGQTASIYSGGQQYQGPGTLFGNAFKSSGNKTENITINVTNSDATPQQIVDKLRQYQRQTGNRILQ